MGLTRHLGRKLLAVYLGGAVGAVLRVGLAEAFPPDPGAWPWPTFVANMAGALLLGYFWALFRDHPEESLAHPFLGTGVCGALTTFATFQLELYDLLDDGHAALAATYCAVSVLAGWFFLRVGINVEEERPRWLR